MMILVAVELVRVLSWGIYTQLTPTPDFQRLFGLLNYVSRLKSPPLNLEKEYTPRS